MIMVPCKESINASNWTGAGAEYRKAMTLEVCRRLADSERFIGVMNGPTELLDGEEIYAMSRPIGNIPSGKSEFFREGHDLDEEDLSIVQNAIEVALGAGAPFAIYQVAGTGPAKSHDGYVEMLSIRIGMLRGALEDEGVDK